MATESDRYLAKAHESLASAEADLAAGRCNSAANRAYYAVFQAAVAALISDGMSADRRWEHRFVSAEFSAKLIWRRKVISSSFAEVIGELFDLRITADYEPDNVPQKPASRGVKKAESLVEAITQWVRRTQVSEPPAEYGGPVQTLAREPMEYVEEMKHAILVGYPSARIDVEERGPRDFTLRVYGDDESIWEIHDLVGARRTEIFCEHDVWIVILPLDQSWRRSN